jgi:hypothetical protein
MADSLIINYNSIIYTYNMSQPNCSRCNTNTSVLPIIYGRPNQQLSERYERGEVYLGGCIYS